MVFFGFFFIFGRISIMKKDSFMTDWLIKHLNLFYDLYDTEHDLEETPIEIIQKLYECTSENFSKTYFKCYEDWLGMKWNGMLNLHEPDVKEGFARVYKKYKKNKK